MITVCLLVSWYKLRIKAGMSLCRAPLGYSAGHSTMSLPSTLAADFTHTESANSPELSVVMPCLNEAATLAACIKQTLSTLREHNISGEVIVADNGSTDNSCEIAEAMGIRIVHVAKRGYGSALMGGIAAAQGKYIVVGDADGSYDFSQIPLFLEKLKSGYDLVVGNRFHGCIQPGAMPVLHKYIGNPLLTGVGRLFFKTPCRDFHCGLRGFTKSAYERMRLCTTGMEFASEMVVKAALFKVPVCEIPTTLSLDGRNRKSHLRSWHDGWRHLRFLLLYSPRWLFFYPGLVLLLFGSTAALWLMPGPRRVGGAVLDIHTLLYAIVAILTGFQALIFAFFTKVFAITEGLLPEDRRLTRAFRLFNLEKGLLVGAVLLMVGIGLAGYSFYLWNRAGFGPMNPVALVRLVASAMVFITLGVEVALSSFFLSILGLARK